MSHMPKHTYQREEEDRDQIFQLLNKGDSVTIIVRDDETGHESTLNKQVDMTFLLTGEEK